MDKKTRNILVVVVLIVVVGPVLLVLLGLGAFIFGDIFHSMNNGVTVTEASSGFSLGSLLKYLGIAIIVIGIPLVLFFTRKKN